MKLSAILKFKGGSILSVTPATLISDVIALLAEKRIGAVVVIDTDGKLVGILSERDIVRTLAEKAGAIFDMTADPLPQGHHAGDDRGGCDGNDDRWQVSPFAGG
jgi:CBS domain-containing protein